MHLRTPIDLFFVLRSWVHDFHEPSVFFGFAFKWSLQITNCTDELLLIRECVHIDVCVWCLQLNKS